MLTQPPILQEGSALRLWLVCGRRGGSSVVVCGWVDRWVKDQPSVCQQMRYTPSVCLKSPCYRHFVACKPHLHTSHCCWADDDLVVGPGKGDEALGVLLRHTLRNDSHHPHGGGLQGLHGGLIGTGGMDMNSRNDAMNVNMDMNITTNVCAASGTNSTVHCAKVVTEASPVTP